MSSNLLYTGATGPRELSPHFERRNGSWVTTRRWRGLKNELLTLGLGFGALDSTLAQEDDIWWILEVPTPGIADTGSDESPETPSLESQIVVSWSMPATLLSKSIWAHPRVLAELNRVWGTAGSSPTAVLEGLAKFRSDIQDLARGLDIRIEDKKSAKHGDQVDPQNVKITLDGIIESLSGLQGGVSIDPGFVKSLFYDLARGVDSFRMDAFTLNKRSVAPRGAKLGPEYENTNRAISTQTLLSMEPTIPENIRDGIPEGYWFKGAPRVSESDSNRFEVNQEWTHADDYSRFLYGDPL